MLFPPPTTSCTSLPHFHANVNNGLLREFAPRTDGFKWLVILRCVAFGRNM
ncbi:hypothetical protein E2C01_097229 [Portunus trituberculatus]|uniref:Uncharacterized protein n=1 Tax=Portunus trituberculatus TaxID=210409 RepID=A0A5B7K9E7_PORTR|nr:hypothetical protein [Portunus trituberculatus]